MKVLPRSPLPADQPILLHLTLSPGIASKTAYRATEQIDKTVIATELEVTVTQPQRGILKLDNY